MDYNLFAVEYYAKDYNANMIGLFSWSKEEFEAANDEQEARAKETYQPMTVRKTDGKKIAEQAKALLQGKEKWQPSWMKYNVAQGR